ncbi:P-loop containing nucleoside triphosphate hydrolase protein [Podospora appendiculata]|uniref:P-loop containing nucleoside triphosphate hydrolase protein n=1 Tax=Podospora appendiculata TaxID=314037 RepID=A0AAE1CBD7_9PEZI|nr:P-loop containing nucleoside triphosphate hydrolase protein [Podospora appendiculata]
MDYLAIHGHDVSSFDLPSTHRLPTVSAARALEQFGGTELNFVPTGLDALDAALGSSLDGLVPPGGRGGVQKGQVTEIWGPPGAGKTALGIQLAANCLREGKGVVWVDGFHRVSSERLSSVVWPTTEGVGELKAFTHYTCPSLAHFIALLCRPTPSCIPQTTSLVVVDSLSALINHSFPKGQEPRSATNANNNKGPPLSARRLQVLQYIIGGLQKLAATRDVAIVILTQCATKMQAEHGATLVPAINATVWEQGISTRLVLFRDWAADDKALSQSLRFAGVQKLNGKPSAASIDDICAFDIQTNGLVAVDCDSTQQSAALLSTPARKRKLDDTNFEIPDSDDEDYGWQDDDDDGAPPMPSQWQGSEDILLQPPKSDDEGDDHPDGDVVGFHHEEDEEYADEEPGRDAAEPERDS